MAAPPGHRYPPPPGTCKLVLSGVLFGTQPCKNIWWLNLTHTGSALAADLSALLGLIDTSYVTYLLSQQSSNYTQTGWDATWIDAPGTSVDAHHIASASGSAGAAPEDAAACYVVDWLIGRYYRGGHPRTYLPGVLNAAITNGSIIGPTYQANLGDQASAWITHVNGLSTGNITAVQLGTVSFALHHAWRNPPVFEAYTGAKVRGFLGTQRRRIGGR